MTFTENLLVTFIDKLVIGLFLLLAGFAINRALKQFENRQNLRRELELSQNQAALAQLASQINELYSPLYGLIQQAQEVHDVAKVRIPSLTSGLPTEEEALAWRYLVEEHLLPLNAQMAKIIRSKIHLVEEDELPGSWKAFLGHQTQFEVLHMLWKETKLGSDHVMGKGWPPTFNYDVLSSLNKLRREYNMYARRIKLTPNGE